VKYTSKLLFSVAVVAIMFLGAVAVTMPSEQSEAGFGPNNYYKYVMTYSGEEITKVEVYDTSEHIAKTITTKNTLDSFWNFNSDGYGPFNSCYAAVEKTTGKIFYRLDPNDLTKTVEGASYNMDDYNIVWLIPTVYWSATETALTLTNYKTSGVTAYAHSVTSSSEPYKYIGIGVYEASTETVNGSTALMSQSGKTPLNNKDIVTFNNYGQNTPGDAVLWNFYHWTFTKMATYMVGMGKNTQQIWGAGKVDGSSASQTGLGNSAGPYVSFDKSLTTTAYSKVFVENTWGSLTEWVGDTVFKLDDGRKKLYAGQHATGITYSTEDDKTPGTKLPSSEGWITATSKNAMDWDLPIQDVGTSNDTDLTVPGDYVYVSNTSNLHLLLVGGSYANASGAGIAHTNVTWISNSNDKMGTRLAYFFDGEPQWRNSRVPAYDCDAQDAYYRYVLDFNGTTVSTNNLASVKSYSSPTDTAGTTMDGLSSWTFSTSNGGYGPFNSFYAAIDNTTGEVVAHLDPNDLGKKVDGSDFVNTGNYCNIMLVIPTVYWSSTTDDGHTYLTLTNDSSLGEPYAHIIDNTVHKYLAIGVYEAYKDSDDDDKLKSISGKNPTVDTKRADFRTYANNNTATASDVNGDWMLWNFYQMSLMKAMTFTVMATIDGQSIYQGNVNSTDSASKTGNGDTAGWRGGVSTGNGIDQYEKVFIENFWGSVWDFVDDVAVNNYTIYLGQNSITSSAWCDSYDASSWATAASYIKSGLPQEYEGAYISKVTLAPSQFFIPTESDNSGLDYYWRPTSDGSFVLLTGGCKDNSGQAGPFETLVRSALDVHTNVLGARLAYVFDTDLSLTVSTSSNDENYGTVSSASMDAMVGSKANMGDYSITFGNSTVIATPNDGGEEYLYTFEGWFDSLGARIETGRVLKSDMQAYAVFSATELCRVDFDLSGKGENFYRIYLPGSALDRITPETYGYVFGGWYKDEGLSERWDYDTDTVQEDITLYAKWSKNPVINPNIYVTVGSDGEIGEREQSIIESRMMTIASAGKQPVLNVTADNGKVHLVSDIFGMLIDYNSRLVFKDKNVTIDVPSKTLAGLGKGKDVVLNVDIKDISVVESLKDRNGEVYDITLMVGGQPYTGLFAEPIDIKAVLDSIKDIDKSFVELFYVNGSVLEKVDIAKYGDTVWFSVPHLSRYALIYDECATAFVKINGGTVSEPGDGWKYSGGYYSKKFAVGSTVSEIMSDLGPIHKSMSIQMGQSSTSSVLDENGMTISVNWMSFVDILLILFMVIVILLILFITFRSKGGVRRY